MKKTVVLFLAVVAVLYIVALNYQLAAQQQPAPQTTNVRFNKVHYGATGTQVSGRIVGFSCFHEPVLGSQCVVATTD